MATGAPLVFLLLLEGLLRLCGYGRPAELFIADTQPGYYRTNPASMLAFFPAQFDLYPLNFRIARHKAPGHLRVFVLGESAVKGTPDPGFGFTALIGPQLSAAYPGRAFEVYNLGIVAINSHAVYEIARQAAQFEPDLFIVYMGNNEVVGPYGPGSVNLAGTPPLWLIRSSVWVKQTRTGQLLAQAAALVGRLSQRSPLAWHGMSTFVDKTVRGDDPRLAGVYSNFESNLRDIIRAGQEAGAKVVVATVVANLRDCAPFASLHRPGMSQPEREAWERSYQAGVSDWELGRCTQAIPTLSGCLALDPQYAEAHFVLASALEQTGDAERARAEYLQALHWDALRFRPDEPINAIIRTVARKIPGVVLCDTALDLGSDRLSLGPPSGRQLLLEHVHFNWEGNVAVSRALSMSAAAALFGSADKPAAWLDSAGCAAAAGLTDVGRLTLLRQMEPIRGKPPFSNQLHFSEEQLRYQKEIERLEPVALSPEGIERSRRELSASIARDPYNPELLFHLADLEELAGDSAGFLAAVEGLERVLPRSAELLVMRARALAGRQEGAEALACLGESIRLDPFNLPSYTALAQVARQTGDFGPAEAELERAVEQFPNNGVIRLAYADLLFGMGRSEESARQCQTVLETEPWNQDALDRLASLFEGEGRMQEALALRERAQATQPLNFANNLVLARLYDRQGDEARTVASLQAAERSGPATAQAAIVVARHLGRVGRHLEERVELARARRLAVISGDLDLARQIEQTMAAER